MQDGDDRASVSTGNPLIDLLARGLGDFYSGQIDKDVAKTPAHAIKYLVCDSGLSDEELGAFFAAGGSGILNRFEYLYRIERKQRSEDRVTKADLLRRDGRPSYLVDYYSGEPAKLSDLATEEGLERFCEHKARFMEAAKLAVPPVDPDRVAALERLESRLEAVQPVKLVPGQIACQLGSSWVPASVIRDFALETFKIGYGHESRVRGSYQTAAQARGLEVRYSEVSGRWGVTSASGGMDESVAKKWGVGSYNCFMILTAALNGGLIQIEKDNPDYNPVAEKSKKKIPDPVATAAANAKRRELEEAFREWVWKDEGRASAQEAPARRGGAHHPGRRGHADRAHGRRRQDIHRHRRHARAQAPGASPQADDRRAEQPHRAVGRRLPQALPRREATRPHRRRGEKPGLGAPVLGPGGIGRLGRRHRRIQPLREAADVLRGAEGGASTSSRNPDSWSWRTAPERRTSRSSRSRACATSSRASSSRSRSETHQRRSRARRSRRSAATRYSSTRPTTSRTSRCRAARCRACRPATPPSAKTS